MKENLTKALVAFYYLCMLIYVPTKGVNSGNSYDWRFFFDPELGRLTVDVERLILQLLAGTCVLLMIRYLIPVFSKEQERSDRTDD
jgi:hypothetical protein